MRFSLNSNILAVGLNRQLSRSSSALESSLRRLSSGSRINSAADDAAGLAISSVLRSSSRVFAQGLRNANDSISLLNVAQGGLGELTGILQRVKELATQSANGSFSRTQRLSLDQEALQLTNEFNRITSSTKFNGRSVFAADFGTLRIQVGFGSEESLAFNMNSSLNRAQGRGSFSAATTISGIGVSGSAVGDFNGDGNQDIAYMESVIPANVTIQFGLGNGQFSNAINLGDIGAGFSQGRDITTGDIDGDGDIDIVAGNEDGEFAVYSNNGSGSFSDPYQFSETAPGNAISLGDFNGDGLVDILYATDSGLTVHYRTFDNKYNAGVSLPTDGQRYNDIAVSDLNNDGILDIVTASLTASSGLSVLLGAGNGSFSPQVRLSSAQYSSVELADMDHNGVLDIVAGGVNGLLEVYRGNGNGTFQSALTRTFAGSGNTFFRTFDINGDGHLDVLAAGASSSSATVLYGQGDGSFASTKTFAARVRAQFEVADFNNDGVQDFFYYENNAQHNVMLQQTEQVTNIARFDLTTQQSSREALALVDSILARVQLELGSIGALQSRVQTAMANLESRKLGYVTAAGRIEDVDVASESAALTRNQILQNTTASLLAQANAAPEILLDILRAAGVN